MPDIDALFPDAPRTLYTRNPLEQVICQVRFPTILKIEAQPPADFQDIIRDLLPIVARTTNPIAIQVPQELLKAIGVAGSGSGYSFSSADENVTANLAADSLAEAQLGASLKTKTAGDIWRRISQNQDIRYQTFSAIPKEDDFAATGIECLVVDFKSIFSMPSDDLYRQLDGAAQRRTCLADLYRENFQARVASYLSRVMLPEPHKYTPPAH